MHEKLVNPNYHVVLVHYPLALLIVGTLIELFSFLWRRSGFRAAGRWMILLGAMAAVPTVFSGLYALYDVSSIGNPHTYEAWATMWPAAPMSAAQREMLIDHMWNQVIATSICLFVVVVWLACSDRARRRLHIPLLIVLLIGIGFIASGAWHGGEAVYRFGTGVSSAAPSTAPEDEIKSIEIEKVVPPLEAHMMLAGWTVAVALAALGLAIRASHRPPEDFPGAAFTGLGTGDEGISHLANEDVRVDTLRDSPGAAAVVTTIPTIVPSARFWLLASLLAILTASVGVWVLARSMTSEGSITWDFGKLQNQVMNPDVPRRLPHVVAGSMIVVVTLLLAIFARWAPRRRLPLFICAVLLLGLVTWQVWVGVLLLFDTPQGPITRFNEPSSVVTPPARAANPVSTAPTTAALAPPPAPTPIPPPAVLPTMPSTSAVTGPTTAPTP